MIGGVVTSMGLFATAFATSFSHVIVTFSIITGTGIGIFFVPGLTIVSYIEEGRTLFNGIAASGVGAGIFVMSNVIPFIIDAFNWRGSMFILAGFALHICVAGALIHEPASIKRLKRQEKDVEEESRTIAVKLGFDLYKNLSLVLFCIHYMAYMAGVSLIYIHLTAMAKTLTKTDEAATLPVSLMGLAQIFGRIISGLIGQSRHVDTFLFYWICSFSAGLAAIVFPFLPSYTSLIIGSVFHSLLSSPANSIYQIVMLYFVDIPQLTIAFTHLTVQIGLGMMIGAPLAGWVYDITGDYGNSFYLGGAIIASGSLLLTWPYIKHRRQRSLPENVELAKRTLSFSSMFGSQVVVASKSERKDTRRYKQVDQKEDIG
ncbi:monocarboxylate transporter 12-like isoform X3 [Lineus longissimus]